MEQEGPQHHHEPSGAEKSSTDPLVEFLHNEYHFPAVDLYIERTFARIGLLSKLEEAGIVPVIEDPNPFDLEENEAAHAAWWTEHPDEQDVYEAQLAERRMLLKTLHIGAILGHLAGRRLYPGRDFPTI